MNMKAKNSAFYQRQYRQRLRELGLIKKEVWILPENAPILIDIEKQLRAPAVGEFVQTDIERKSLTMNTSQLWTASDLLDALAKVDLFSEKRASVELINGAEPCLHFTMHDYGDLPLFLSIAREQILVEALLWPVNEVINSDKFNEEVLRTRKLFPLSTIGIETMGNGELSYIMFGALSATSLLSNIIFELETLADNVIKATEAFESHLKNPV
jgi:uncharacterized protein YjfI (DUF2170 family)